MGDSEVNLFFQKKKGKRIFAESVCSYENIFTFLQTFSITTAAILRLHLFLRKGSLVLEGETLENKLFFFLFDYTSHFMFHVV